MKNLCGRPVCPILVKEKIFKQLSTRVDKEVVGESPSVFVGRIGYPKVFVGPLTAEAHDTAFYDAPEQWYGEPIDNIVDMRLKLFRGKQTIAVKEAKDPQRDLEALQEIAMSKRPPDTDLQFKKKPNLKVSFSPSSPPFGPSGNTYRFDLQENTRVRRPVDKVVNDDLKAAAGMEELYNKKIEISSISKILSIGLLGLDKKLVPTRWSITATDDTIGRKHIEKVKEFDEISQYSLFTGAYLDNHFKILLVPGKWAFEMIELYTPGCIWVTGGRTIAVNDYERYKGRKKYASNVEGAYYAARLGVCEYLQKTKRQASVFIVREIRKGYHTPVGVWQIRENVRYAMKTKPQKFNTLQSALEDITNYMETKNAWEKKSELLATMHSRELMRKFFT